MYMKTIMIIDEQNTITPALESDLNEEDITLISVENSRKALEMLQENPLIDLYLISSELKNEIGYISISPQESLASHLKADISLSKPFSKEQFLDFIKNQIPTKEKMITKIDSIQ